MRDCKWKFCRPASMSRLLMLTFASRLFRLISNNCSFLYKYDLQFDMSKWLKLEGHVEFYHALGTLSPLRWEAHSIVMNSLRLPLSPYNNAEYSLIFPFETFPNNMTTFSCALTEPSVWRITAHRLSVSQSPTTWGPGWDNCWKFAGASAASLGWQCFVWDTPDVIPHFELS